MSQAVLYIFSGLPGVGKSTLAKKLSVKTDSFFLRVDTIEQGLRGLCDYEVVGEGYELAYSIAKDNLSLGSSVVADSVNPVMLSRKAWNKTAVDSGAHYINIEIKCSNISEHKQRLESRDNGIKNLKNPTWEQVVNRDYHEWNQPRILIDTSGKTVDESFADLLKILDL